MLIDSERSSTMQSKTYAGAALELEGRRDARLAVIECEPAVAPSGTHGHAAILELEDGRRLHVSRIEGASEWVLDGLTLANGLPVFYNGLFARCCAVRHVTDERVIRVLEAWAV
jgi:hypothetical protein